MTVQGLVESQRTHLVGEREHREAACETWKLRIRKLSLSMLTAGQAPRQLRCPGIVSEGKVPHIYVHPRNSELVAIVPK